MAAFRRYYPGFFGAAFLVLLRIAIGWHLLSEGLFKIMSTEAGRGSIIVDAKTTREAEAKGEKGTEALPFARYFHPSEGPPFSSEAYNRNASGPFAAQFRSLIPDVEGRDLLDFGKLKSKWRGDLDRVALHYGFDDKQKDKAASALDAQEKVAAAWFEQPETHDKIQKYLDGLDNLDRLAARPNKMSFEIERYYEARKSLEADRKALVAPIDSWTKTLRDAWDAVASDEQEAKAGPYRAPLSQVELADRITMYGLSICGALLMIGLLTPVAALGAAGFLALFYFSMPPWPGLPVPPNAEGHYVFVNKNLIEMLACLALAATPNGLWLGVDSLLFGWIDRVRYRRAVRREQAEFERAVREAAEHRGAVASASADVPRPSKHRR